MGECFARNLTEKKLSGQLPALNNGDEGCFIKDLYELQLEILIHVYDFFHK